MQVVPYLLKFLDDLTNVYVRFNCKRLKGHTGEDDCRIALSTLLPYMLTMTSLLIGDLFVMRPASCCVALSFRVADKYVELGICLLCGRQVAVWPCHFEWPTNMLNWGFVCNAAGKLPCGLIISSGRQIC
ncbi:hypothetical protein RHMOL_Rhmol05G0180100 [Rhododendron molle]|uniref:Uncharacterized protein n=1 Tax=Rhododendron molle TaxID=49168 RepID=A0ACC0NSM5_RHOML|nr:hypothetical protein RHMOL_Rhmol05G0180100 [Rhododendron molle]